MVKDFLASIGDNYYVQLVIICGVLAIVFYGFLNPEKKRNPQFLIAFLVVLLVLFYEVLAVWMLVNKSINQKIHYFLTDDPFQGWNIWVYNIFYYQVSRIGLLLLIGVNLKKSISKKIVMFLGIFFLFYCISSYFSEAYPLHDIQQPILYFLSNTILIVASGLFFIDLITEEYYLDINPVTYLPFWYITLIMFHSVILFMADVANEYLTLENIQVYFMFNLISRILYVLLLGVFTLLIFTGKNFLFRTAKL